MRSVCSLPYRVFYPAARPGTPTACSSQRPNSEGASGSVAARSPRPRPGSPAALRDRASARGCPRRPAPPPFARECRGHLDVELEPVRVAVRERLVAVHGRAGQEGGALGQVEGIAVPLERREARRGAREAWADGRAARCGEQLRPETDPPDRVAGARRLGDDALLLGQPRMRIVLVGAHRTAHHDHPVELAPVGRRFAHRGTPAAAAIASAS